MATHSCSITSQRVLTVVVGSRNPVKVAAARGAISRLFPDHKIECQGVDAPSGVPEQPMTDEETRLGAINRCQYCIDHYQGDFFVAIEGGVDQFVDGPATFAYVVISNGRQQGVGRSCQLPLPMRIYQALTQGEELGDVMDRLFNTTNIKQKGGAIGLLTQHQASRAGVYEQACILAMAPILHSKLYQSHNE
ncbi:inosine/xanthosine triphosphatase [Motilimonas eburnea]|uniref:inosine/xanthosine triphosphatase n=1 Tax=Motilimonas eburnea TaxID=1737488 RepID=UPI001E4F6286|nr:inosine/xanthosine triphosphatase [Motilimonas eburnea]MCE2570444.1 inosine/xanthosine triphosphatase [Motilimonas eburnea]